MSRAELARALARGETPDRIDVLKRNRARCVGIVDGAVLKVFLRDPRQARREARALRLAAKRGISVPELLESGPDWIATRFLAGREARRDDLEAILAEVERMHARGMLHGDLHLGNIWVHEGRPVLLDLHRSRFLPVAPGFLRRRELGYLAFSLGEPLPETLAAAGFWRDRRAHRHWRSRTRRCLIESTGFTSFEGGFRRRDVDPNELRAALARTADVTPFKGDGRTGLYRIRPWILKQHRSARAARAAWIGGHGLEMRGIRTGLALAWSGRWLWMQDAGVALSDWVESSFADAKDTECDELAVTLAELLAALHRRCIYHADLKANNVSWSPGREPRLLDYGRVHFRRRVGSHRRIENLAQLNAALPDLVPNELRERSFAHYVARSELLMEPAALRDAVIQRSLARRHRWSGCQNDP